MLFIGENELNLLPRIAHNPLAADGVVIVGEHGEVTLTPDGLYNLAVLTGNREWSRDYGQGLTEHPGPAVTLPEEPELDPPVGRSDDDMQRSAGRAGYNPRLG